MSREVCEHGELIEGLCPQCLEMGKAYRESLPKYIADEFRRLQAENAAMKAAMRRGKTETFTAWEIRVEKTLRAYEEATK